MPWSIPSSTLTLNCKTFLPSPTFPFPFRSFNVTFNRSIQSLSTCLLKTRPLKSTRLTQTCLPSTFSLVPSTPSIYSSSMTTSFLLYTSRHYLNRFARSDGRFITYKPVTPGLRHRRDIDLDALGVYQGDPVKALTIVKHRQGGRNHSGRITIRGRGGGPKRILRNVDFLRFTTGPHVVLRIEFDPFRSAFLALLQHQQSKALSYIIAPQGLKQGDIVQSFRQGLPQSNSNSKTEDNSSQSGPSSGENIHSLIQVGNCFQLRDIPVGSTIHCIGLRESGQAQLCRSAGTSAQLLSTSDKKYAHVRLQSGEVRLISLSACATIGAVSNPDWMHRRLGKAGAKRNLGRRPKVRGVAMNPCDHPHGGGEGRTKGKHPVTPWGMPTKGYRTRRKSKPTWWIIEDRRKNKK